MQFLQKARKYTHIVQNSQKFDPEELHDTCRYTIELQGAWKQNTINIMVNLLPTNILLLKNSKLNINHIIFRHIYQNLCM